MSALDERRRLRLAPPEPIESAAHSRGIRLVIGDGHTLLRAGVRALLDGQQPIRVVGEASDGEQAVALARRMRADMVLMDVNLPGLSSIEGTRRLLTDPAIPVLLLTPSASDDATTPRYGLEPAAWCSKTPNPASSSGQSRWLRAERRCCPRASLAC